MRFDLEKPLSTTTSEKCTIQTLSNLLIVGKVAYRTANFASFTLIILLRSVSYLSLYLFVLACNSSSEIFFLFLIFQCLIYFLTTQALYPLYSAANESAVHVDKLVQPQKLHLSACYKNHIMLKYHSYGSQKTSHFLQVFYQDLITSLLWILADCRVKTADRLFMFGVIAFMKRTVVDQLKCPIIMPHCNTHTVIYP